MGTSAGALVGVATAIILASMGGGWLLRTILLKTLRNRYPAEFARLGNPSTRELGSLLPRYREMQLQFWKYLWGGEIFAMKDKLLSGLAAAALASDVALGIGVVLLFWSAGR